MPALSVVLPVFNAELHVEQALRSLLKQTFGDFEVWALDDGSTDASAHVLRSIARDDSRVQVISRENRGLIETLNEGVQRSSGRWIARMDADDVSAPQRFARQLAQLDAEDADICGTGIRYIGDITGITRIYPSSDAAVKFRLLFDCALSHPSVIGRAEVFKAHPYDPQARHSEDYELWCRMARHGVRLTNVPEILLDYRIHAQQVSASRRLEQIHVADRVSAQYTRWYLDTHAAGDLLGRFDDTLDTEGRPLLSRRFEFLRQLAERLSVDDEHLDGFFCASAAARGIPRQDALQLYRMIAARPFASRSDKAKLFVGGFLGANAYSRFKRLYSHVRGRET